MKKFLFLVLSMMIIVGISACNKGEQKTQEESAPVVKEVKGIEGVTVADLAFADCSGCGMSLEKHAITDTVHYEGAVYGFCNAGCKDNFVKDPKAAISKLQAKKEETPPPPAE